MNVYDFDGTIYRGDSTVDFYLFSLKTQPSLIRYLPVQLWGCGMYILKRYNKVQWKESFFSFLQGTDAASLTDRFWKKHRSRVENWYLAQHREDDLVISASPEFLLGPICQDLSIGGLLATRVDPATGRFLGENCRGEEKVRRFEAEYPGASVEKFYSDSRSDLPMARLAEEAFLVKKGMISPWRDL